MSQFRQGQKLKGIFWPNEGHVNVGDGKYDAKSITVVEEYGQMALVPWALVEFNDGRRFKYNLALCEGVILFEDGEER